MKPIGSTSGIGAPLSSNRVGGDNFIRYIGDRLILDFHEGAGTTVRDLSGWGNDLILTGSQDWRLGSFHLDGSSYFSIADASQTGLDMGLSDFMVEARIKTTSTTPYEVIVSKQVPTGDWKGWSLARDSDPDTLYAVIDSGVAQATVDSTAFISDGRYHYVVLVVDRSSPTGLKLYVDGSETAYDSQGDPSSVLSIDNSVDFVVGGFGTGSYPWTGFIDCVRIWNFGVDGLHIGPIGILQQYLYHKWNTN